MYEAAGNALPADADHVEAIKLTEQLSHATLLPASPGASEDDAPRCPDLRALGIELVVFDCAGTVIDEGTPKIDTQHHTTRVDWCAIRCVGV
jgi:hypothetical protein